MSGVEALINGIVARYLPSSFVDDRDDPRPVRLGRYGEIVAQVLYGPTKHAQSDEGSYLVATNPTISTGVTWVTAQTTFLDTAPNFYIFNTENPNNANAKSLYLDYLKLIPSQAATTATSIQYAAIIDVQQRAFTTDNTLVIIPTNPNSLFNVSSQPLIKVQNNATASVIAASSPSKRIVSRGTLGGLNIAGEEFVLVFGSTDVGSFSPVASAAGQPGRRVGATTPVILAPGHSLAIHFWMPGSAASLNPEFELGMWMR